MGTIGSALKRFGIAIASIFWRFSNTDGINQAVVEDGMRKAKEKLDKAHYANGQLQGTIIRLKDQIAIQERKKSELERLMTIAANQNNDTQGAYYAEQLESLQQDLTTNLEQLNGLTENYQQNTAIIANSIRELQKFQMDYERLKTRVAISRQLESLAELSKSSITELQGTLGGEMGEAMNQLKITASNGEGQMKATMDLAKEMGAGIKMQQEARQMQGKMLFQEWKAKHGMVQKDAAAEPKAENKKVEKQRIETA